MASYLVKHKKIFTFALPEHIFIEILFTLKVLITCLNKNYEALVYEFGYRHKECRSYVDRRAQTWHSSRLSINQYSYWISQKFMIYFT